MMLFGRKPRKTKHERKWCLAGVEIQETDSDKYLGVDLVSGLNFKGEDCGRCQEEDDVGMGDGDEERGVACRALLRVWNALVRPVLEYGAVIWGDVQWEEAEVVQRWER